jgi:hypothetical protein
MPILCDVAKVAMILKEDFSQIWLLAKYEEVIAQGSCPRITFFFPSNHRNKKFEIKEKNLNLGS